jgi:phospholipid/cholesterol/gamma-HCH transport system substrate-binding protein
VENRAHALAAGGFVLLLGIALILAAWWMEERHNDTREYLLVTTRSVTGLNPQAQVRYRGIRAGKVLDISLDPRDARLILVRINLDADLPVTRATRARLNAQGVTGLSYVMLEDDNSDLTPMTAAPGELPRIALEPSGIDAIGDTAARISRAFDERTVQDFKRTLANLAVASEGMKELPMILSSLRQVLSTDNLASLRKLLAHLERTAGEAAPLTAELRGLVSSLQGLSRRLDRVADEAGRAVGDETLPRLHELMRDLQLNSRQLNRVLENLEQAPQAVIFGPAEPMPGPGEDGYVARPH